MKIDMCEVELDNIERNYQRGLIDEVERDEAIEDTIRYYNRERSKS